MRGNKDYVETPWLSNMAELAEAELAPPPPHSKAPQVDVRSFEGRLRKTSCSSFGMGMKVIPILYNLLILMITPFCLACTQPSLQLHVRGLVNELQTECVCACSAVQGGGGAAVRESRQGQVLRGGGLRGHHSHLWGQVQRRLSA